MRQNLGWVRPCTVTIQGHLLGETVKHTLEVELQPLAESGSFPLSVPTIHHLTGKAFIRDLLLEEEPGEMAVKEEVVKLSCECGVISKHTAFIAIDEEQKEPVKGSLQIWDVVANHPVLEPHKHDQHVQFSVHSLNVVLPAIPPNLVAVGGT